MGDVTDLAPFSALSLDGGVTGAGWQGPAEKKAPLSSIVVPWPSPFTPPQARGAPAYTYAPAERLHTLGPAGIKPAPAFRYPSYPPTFPRFAPRQCFGEKDADEEFSEADVLSAVEFDETGQFLATGDKGGRIVIFERAGSGKVRRTCASACGGGRCLGLAVAR
jgi:hypothetical protein